jgi:hypothetical protein
MWSGLLSPIHTPDKRAILDAIKQLGAPILPADVAKKTGLPLLKVTAGLNDIASETGGKLQVSDSGTIIYQFDPRFENAYWINGSRHLIRSGIRVLLNLSAFILRLFCFVMFLLIRISFGLALVVSIGAVILLVLFAVAKASNSDDNISGSSGGLNPSGIFDASGNRPFYLYWAFDWLWDWSFWEPILYPTYEYPTFETNHPGATSYPDSRVTIDSKRRTEIPNCQDRGSKREDPKSNFLLDCFTFLFGSGDPNAGFEEKRWQAIAQVIAENQGVVSCEQIAPYSGGDPKEENWMLPILVRFNGGPEVGPAGQIIYVFPEFRRRSLAISGTASVSAQSTTADSASSDGRAVLDELRSLYRNHLAAQTEAPIQNRTRVDKYLPEKTWEFMKISEQSITWICLWACIVLCSSAWLVAHLALVSPFAPLVYALFAYGCFFVVMPAVRWLMVECINGSITARNERKLEYAAMLANPSKDLSIKLEYARKIRAESGSSQPERVVYSTDRDLLQQEFERGDQL